MSCVALRQVSHCLYPSLGYEALGFKVPRGHSETVGLAVHAAAAAFVSLGAVLWVALLLRHPLPICMTDFAGWPK